MASYSSEEWYQLLRAMRWSDDVRAGVVRGTGADALLEQILLTLVEKKDETLKVNLLILLQENASTLLGEDHNKVNVVCAALDALLNAQVETNNVTFHVKGQVLVTTTTILIEVDAITAHTSLFESFVEVMLDMVSKCSGSGSHPDESDRHLRQVACNCLLELETAYPGLLTAGLGHLAKFVHDEMTHACQAYMTLFVTVLEHATMQLFEDGQGASWWAGLTATQAAAAIAAAETPSGIGGRTSVGGRTTSVLSSSSRPSHGNNSDAVLARMLSTSTQLFPFKVPGPLLMAASGENVSSSGAPVTVAPLTPAVSTPGSARASLTPSIGGGGNAPGPGTVARVFSDNVLREVQRCIHFVLDNTLLLTPWGCLYVGRKLLYVARRFEMSPQMFKHQYFGLSSTFSPVLVHLVLLVQLECPGVLSAEDEDLLRQRLVCMLRNQELLAAHRALIAHWLVRLSRDHRLSEAYRGRPMLYSHFPDLYPVIFDSNEVVEAKLYALVHCFSPLEDRVPSEKGGTYSPPEGFLEIMTCLSLFKYGPSRSQEALIVFSVLFRILCMFPSLYGAVEKVLVDTILECPRFLPNVIALIDAVSCNGSNLIAERLLQDVIAVETATENVEGQVGLAEYPKERSVSASGGAMPAPSTNGPTQQVQQNISLMGKGGQSSVAVPRASVASTSAAGQGALVSSARQHGKSTAIRLLKCLHDVLVAGCDSMRNNLAPSAGDNGRQPTMKYTLDYYFDLMKRVLQEPDIDGTRMLETLYWYVRASRCYDRNHVKDETVLWTTGQAILEICRATLLSHPTSKIITPLSKLLAFVTNYHADIEIRDRAYFYYNLLTHLSGKRLQAVLDGELGDAMSVMNGALLKSGEVKIEPEPPMPLESHEAKKFLKLLRIGSKKRYSHFMSLGVAPPKQQTYSLLQSFQAALTDESFKPTIRVAFALRYTNPFQKGADSPESTGDLADLALTRSRTRVINGNNSEGLHSHTERVPEKKSTLPIPSMDSQKNWQGRQNGVQFLADDGGNEDPSAKLAIWPYPKRIYSLVLYFSHSEDYEDIPSVHLPFLSCPDSPSVDDESFPHQYCIEISLRPLAPIPSLFDVTILYNKDDGSTNYGSLQPLPVYFDDVILPLSLPAASLVPIYCDEGRVDDGALCMTPEELNVEIFGLVWNALVPERLRHLSRRGSASTTGVPTPKDAPTLETFDEVWTIHQGTGVTPAESVKMLEISRKKMLHILNTKLAPFLVWRKEQCSVDENTTTPVHSRGGSITPGGGAPRSSPSPAPMGASMAFVRPTTPSSPLSFAEAALEGGDVPSLSNALTDQLNEDCWVYIFLPPRFNILLKIAIGDMCTVIQIRCDDSRNLLFLDSFLDGLSSGEERAPGKDDSSKTPTDKRAGSASSHHSVTPSGSAHLSSFPPIQESEH